MGIAGGSEPAAALADRRGPLRLFVAVDIPESHKLSIEKAIQKLRFALPDARWVPRENWHCTLKFLGEVSDERIQEVREITGEASSRARPLTSRLTAVGAFPRGRRVRVIWVGIEDAANELSYLAMRLEKKLGKAGFRQESRKLTPHITIARLREPLPIGDLIEESGPYSLSEAPFEIVEAVIYRSHLSPRGASYEPLERFSFSVV